jgi:hypothetical protein
MSDCDRCGRPLDAGRLRGHCEPCRRLCPRCGLPNGRKASAGYCAACQRARRSTRICEKQPTPRRGQTLTLEPGLRNGQVWFPNPTPEQRLPIQHITLDVARTVHVLRTFYREDEFRTLVELCQQHVDHGGSERDTQNGRKPK